jgi:hypothetical protein
MKDLRAWRVPELIDVGGSHLGSSSAAKDQKTLALIGKMPMCVVRFAKGR